VFWKDRHDGRKGAKSLLLADVMGQGKRAPCASSFYWKIPKRSAGQSAVRQSPARRRFLEPDHAPVFPSTEGMKPLACSFPRPRELVSTAVSPPKNFPALVIRASCRRRRLHGVGRHGHRETPVTGRVARNSRQQALVLVRTLKFSFPSAFSLHPCLPARLPDFSCAVGREINGAA